MAWIYLAESEDSLKPWMDMSRLPPTAKTTDTHRLYSCLGCKVATFQERQYGTTCEHCGDRSFSGRSLLSMEDFPAKTFLVQDAQRAWQESEADYLERSSDLQVNYNQHSFSWKMCQLFGIEEPTLLSENWPASGMTLAGSLYQLPKLEPTIDENDGGYWPTPNVPNGGRSPKGGMSRTGVTPDGKKRQVGLENAVKMWPTMLARDSRTFKGAKRAPNATGAEPLTVQVGGTLNPMWVEWLMGYPNAWTVLEPWAMQWFRPKRAKRLKG